MTVNERIAYKLVTLRKDGTIGPLFINRSQRIPFRTWIQAEDKTKSGYASRPGWHCVLKPHAPHLSTKGRIWIKVKIKDYKLHNKPSYQGGLWALAKYMRVIGIIPNE